VYKVRLGSVMIEFEGMRFSFASFSGEVLGSNWIFLLKYPDKVVRFNFL
jgi:hypothetical protein